MTRARARPVIGLVPHDWLELDLVIGLGLELVIGLGLNLVIGLGLVVIRAKARTRGGFKN